jgi:hypothetical protein
MPRFTRRLTSVLLCSAATLLLPAAASAGETAPAGFKSFAPDSIWNLPVRADAPLDARSPSYALWLDAQVEAHGAWINTTACAMPTYWATASTPSVRVTLHAASYQDPAMLRAWSAVPIPPDAAPANCVDKNFAVIQRQPDGTFTQWEFWAATKLTDGGWVARWGGVTQNVMADRGIASAVSWTDPTAPATLARASRPGWHVTASSVSMTAGVITARDMAQGRIDHAISVALPSAAKGRWMWPAQRTDGTSVDLDALPEGAHLRLDPSVNVASLGMVPLARMIAEAAQKYGLVVRDQTWDAAVFYTEGSRIGEVNPFKPLLNGLYPDKALEPFPWSKLQVLRSQDCTDPVSCQATERVSIGYVPRQTTPRVGESLTWDTSNSVLNHPRTAVEWDLDGNGSYETNAGREVKVTYRPAATGSRIVRVRITTRGGAVVLGQRTVFVSSALSYAGVAAAAAPPTRDAPLAGGVAQAPASNPVAPDARMTTWQEASRLSAEQVAAVHRVYDKQLGAAQLLHRSARRR